jgi:hypothetical protein
VIVHSNSKYEARAKHTAGINPKQARIFKIQIPETKSLDFEIVSNWSLTDASPDISISDFPRKKTGEGGDHMLWIMDGPERGTIKSSKYKRKPR